VRPSRRGEWLVTLPSLGWLLVFFLVPTLIVFAFAFRPADPFGGVGAGLTLATLAGIARDGQYAAILWRTLWVSLLTTVLCLVLATPAGYAIARAEPRLRSRLMLLVIVPFWTSFLVRIFAWKAVLHPEGGLKRALVALGLVGETQNLLYTPGAVLLVMVYTFLPFAILPVYAAAEKFDFRLLEAARDLGAGRLRAFVSVFLPGIERGLLTACLVVFIPALGSYVIPDLVGGPGGEMLGNKIAQRVFVDRNLPHASALSALLVVAVLLPMAAVLVLQARARAPETIVGEDA
jgi:spermidine/putrescine transport system permease protein